MVTLVNGVPRHPKKFVFVLMDNFTMLSCAGAVDALRIANRLAEAKLYDIVFAGEGGEEARSSSGAVFRLAMDLEELNREDTVVLCSGVEVQAAPAGVRSSKGEVPRQPAGGGQRATGLQQRQRAPERQGERGRPPAN